jgi:hypothetical protein
MTRSSLPTWLGILAFSSALTATPAQACLFGLPFTLGTPSCAAGPAGSPACPTRAQPGGRDGDCLLHKRDLMDAASAMGGMAAGGMEMAGGLLRALADKAMRAVPPEQGL